MKLFIWKSEYEVYLSLAETEDEAKTNILLEAIYTENIITNEIDFSKINFILDKEIENALKEKPIILENGAMILEHGNE